MITSLAIVTSLVGGTPLMCQEKANDLQRLVAQDRKQVPKLLDPKDDVSYGEYGFHYERKTDELTLRILVGRLYYGQYGAESDERFRQTARVFANPNNTKMFDLGGAHLVDDEVRNGAYLVKSYPVKTTDPHVLANDITHLQLLAARYMMSWSRHILEIAKGKEAPPPHFVTLENDPYVKSR